MILTVIVVAVLGGALVATFAIRALDDESRAADGRSTAPALPALCGELRSEVVGRLADPSLDEVSGLVASTGQPGVWWAIEDSGAAPVLVALSAMGETRATVAVTGARNVDWEDIARAPGATAKQSTLLIADIGDNGSVRTDVALYRVDEPTLTGTNAPTKVDGQRFVLQYPDGPRDAEALLVDPRGGDVYVFSKRADGDSGMYRAAAPLSAATPNVMQKVATLSLGIGSLVTAADVSPSGDVVALRTYTSVLVWNRAVDETIAEAMADSPCHETTVIDGQSESLAIAPDSRSIVVVPEGANPRIRRLTPTG